MQKSALLTSCICRFDLGTVVYAINGFRDPQSGRVIVWAWLQENGRHCEDEYSYSGCLTSARELLIRYEAPHRPARPC